MLSDTEKRQVLPLSVDVYQVLSQGGQCLEGHDMAVDAANVAPFEVDLSGQDKLVAILIDPVIPQRRQDSLSSGLRHLKQALHPRLLRSRAHRCAVGAATQKKADGVDDDGLAGPSLSGKDVEPGRQFQVQTVDDGEISDAQESQHGPGPEEVYPSDALDGHRPRRAVTAYASRR